MKPAQAIAPEDGEIIRLLRETFKDETALEQLASLRAEFRGIVRGLENRVATLERENYALRNWIAANETGVRTHAERKDAMAGLVADCGRADDAG
jgi:hypothetical protein